MCVTAFHQCGLFVGNAVSSNDDAGELMLIITIRHHAGGGIAAAYKNPETYP